MEPGSPAKDHQYPVASLTAALIMNRSRLTPSMASLLGGSVALLVMLLAGVADAQGPCCSALGRLSGMVQPTLVTPPAPGNLGDWKGKFVAEAARVRDQICITNKDRQAQKLLDALVKRVQSLTYTSPGATSYEPMLERRKKFAGIMNDLDDSKRAAACPGVAAAPVVTCKTGEQPNPVPGDPARQQVVDGIQTALKQIVDEEVAGKTPAEANRILERYKVVKDAWDKVKTASCLPPQIPQALRDYATEKSASKDTADECNTLCKVTTDWVRKLTSDAQAKFFMDKCLGSCR